MWETHVRSLGQEDPLEKEMATHSSILAWRIPGQRSLVGYSPRGPKKSDRTERLHFHFLFTFICDQALCGLGHIIGSKSCELLSRQDFDELTTRDTVCETDL